LLSGTNSEALDCLTHERTTFIISHNLRIVDDANLILYLEKGKIVEQSTHAELMNLGDRYAKIADKVSSRRVASDRISLSSSLGIYALSSCFEEAGASPFGFPI
jgi:ABC-type multidrug transport system ATPase subunit